MGNTHFLNSVSFIRKPIQIKILRYELFFFFFFIGFGVYNKTHLKELVKKWQFCFLQFFLPTTLMFSSIQFLTIRFLQSDFPKKNVFYNHIFFNCILKNEHFSSKPNLQKHFQLGKPPPSKPAPEEIPSSLAPAKPAEPAKELSKPASSFLDFLIPSFIRGSSKTDPEGPPKPPPANPRPRNPPPTKSAVRPLNTFPHPAELGGKENPIRVRIGPDGIPQLPTPPGIKFR